MSTLTIELPDDLAARLSAASERKSVPPAQIILESLERALPEPVEDVAPGKTAYDLMKADIGCVSTGIGDLATNQKHMEGFGEWRR